MVITVSFKVTETGTILIAVNCVAYFREMTVNIYPFSIDVYKQCVNLSSFMLAYLKVRQGCH